MPAGGRYRLIAGIFVFFAESLYFLNKLRTIELYKTKNRFVQK